MVETLEPPRLSDVRYVQIAWLVWVLKLQVDDELIVNPPPPDTPVAADAKFRQLAAGVDVPSGDVELLPQAAATDNAANRIASILYDLAIIPPG